MEQKSRANDLQVELIPKAGAPGEFEMKQKVNKLSFDQGFFVAVRAIQLLREKTPGRLIFVGIAGPSGAGKTSIAHKIMSVLPKSLLISLDNYLDSSRKVIDDNFDDFRLIDFELLIKNLRELRAGTSTATPLYDFRKSGRYAYKEAAPPESRVVLVEGTYALHECVRPWYDLMISVSGGVHFDLIKRIFRDTQRTGQEPKESMQQIMETVYPMYKAFIEPDLSHSHISIVNTFNPFGGLLNPFFTLKSEKKISEEDIKTRVFNNSPSLKHRTEKYYDIYLQPPGDECSDTRHWIRMRNYNGQYIVMFSESIREEGFIISPRIEFQVDVKALGGLMALGYKIGCILNRSSEIWEDEVVAISFDHIEQLGATFVQIKGTKREAIVKAGESIGLTGTYIPKSYIELYLEKQGAITENVAAGSVASASSDDSSSSSRPALMSKL